MTSDLDETSLDPAALASLLRWYVEMGVDLAIGEMPLDRFAEAAKPETTAPGISKPQIAAETHAAAPSLARPAISRRLEPAPKPEAASTDAIEQSAREAAETAATLDELRARLDQFQGCSLKRTATQLVFADGNPDADIMFVGEAPGADEDRMGKPFVGRAGQLLDKMLASIGLSRQSVYIANVVPWRPPGNRTPTPAETAACLPFTRRQIELVNPQILVCLGAPSAQTLLGITNGIKQARGRWMPYQLASGRSISALAMLHPAYLLRMPGDKSLAWQDLRMLAKKIAANSGV